MGAKPILVLTGLTLIIIVIVSFYPHLQCKLIQDDYKNYVDIFKNTSCANDGGCTGTGPYNAGTCGFCVSSSIDLLKLRELHLQFMDNRCHDKGFSTDCLAAVRYCKCIEYKCQSSPTQ